MNQRIKLFLIFLIPFISFVINTSTLSHYGINWDEPYHYRRGQAFLNYFLTGSKIYNMPKYPPLKGDSDNPNFRNGQEIFQAVQKNPSLSDQNFRRSIYQDDSWDGKFFIDTENTYGHPPLNDVLAALFNKIFYQKLGIMGDLEAYKFFTVLVTSLAALFIAYFMFKEFGIIESIFASLFFTTYPLLVAEQHFDIKDPVETAFYAITILSAYWGVKRNNFKWLFISIVFFGLALGTKFNIVFSLIPLTLWFIFYILKNKKVNKNLLKKIGIILIIAPIICLGILIASYPTLWKNPINGIIQIVKFYLEVGYPSSTSYGYYFFNFFNALPSIWIIITTPPVELLLFIVAIVALPKLIKRNDFVFLLSIWLFVVIGRNSFFKALNYGGVRLIMEYIPALGMLTAIAAGYIIRIKKNKKNMAIVFGVLIIFFIPSLIKIINIHPNENEYFNFIIGGLSGAKAKNLPDWGNSDGNAYVSGVDWLNKNAEINAKVSTPIGNTSNIPRIKLRKDIALSPYYWSGLEHKGEYVIELTYDYPQMKWFALKYLNVAMIPVYEVKVDGVAIAKVWKNDLAHVKPEFLNTKIVTPKISVEKEKKNLILTLPSINKVMQVTIQQPIKNCTPLHTGYVTLSEDGKIAVREEEDIAVDQLKRDEVKILSNTYEYNFVSVPAKILTFNVDTDTNCLLKATSAKVTVLND
jgi:hypothetical protein